MAGTTTHHFTDFEPSLGSYWRGVVLFGRNVASYKFALAKSLLELAEREQEAVPLTDLADPFARHICQHLETADKQGTFGSSRFLDACRRFNRGEIERDELLEITTRLGFQNVIDAFHVVGRNPVPVRFFEDERRSAVRGIRLTDNVNDLVDQVPKVDLEAEAESRWRLVETSWELGLPRDLLTVSYEPDGELLVPANRLRRKAITSARDALNGYQKGQCFYCYGPITVESGNADLAQVDHFFPHLLKTAELGQAVNLDGIWNLVLACRACNGAAGKGSSVPDLSYLERLHGRNEFLIASHHPLRQTLIVQTGGSEQVRGAFLNGLFREARASGAALDPWRTPARAPAAF